jgi:hypothetical protein
MMILYILTGSRKPAGRPPGDRDGALQVADFSASRRKISVGTYDRIHHILFDANDISCSISRAKHEKDMLYYYTGGGEGREATAALRPARLRGACRKGRRSLDPPPT